MTDRWYALFHRRGPALAESDSLNSHPDFMKHVAFLEGLERGGMLIASGPLAGERDFAMTVLRLRPEHGQVDIERMASEDDAAVVSEVITVDVRPWGVMRAVV